MMRVGASHHGKKWNSSPSREDCTHPLYWAQSLKDCLMKWRPGLTGHQLTCDNYISWWRKPPWMSTFDVEIQLSCHILQLRAVCSCSLQADALCRRSTTVPATQSAARCCSCWTWWKERRCWEHAQLGVMALRWYEKGIKMIWDIRLDG